MSNSCSKFIIRSSFCKHYCHIMKPINLKDDCQFRPNISSHYGTNCFFFFPKQFPLCYNITGEKMVIVWKKIRYKKKAWCISVTLHEESRYKAYSSFNILHSLMYFTLEFLCNKDLVPKPLHDDVTVFGQRSTWLGTTPQQRLKKGLSSAIGIGKAYIVFIPLNNSPNHRALEQRLWIQQSF